MSALDHLVEILDAGGPHAAFTSEEVARMILSEHAHELAEKIRAEFPREISAKGSRFYSEAWSAANVIDPGTPEDSRPVVGQTYRHRTDPGVTVTVTGVWQPQDDELYVAYDIHSQRFTSGRLHTTHSVCRLSLFVELYREVNADG